MKNWRLYHLLLIVFLLMGGCSKYYTAGSIEEVEIIKNEMSKKEALEYLKEFEGKKQHIIAARIGNGELLSGSITIEKVEDDGITYTYKRLFGAKLPRKIIFDQVKCLYTIHHSGLIIYTGGTVYVSDRYPLRNHAIDNKLPLVYMAPLAREFLSEKRYNRFIASFDILCPNITDVPPWRQGALKTGQSGAR